MNNEEKFKEGLKAFTEMMGNAIDDLNKLIPEKPEPKTVSRGQFVPNYGGFYYCINAFGDVIRMFWNNDAFDNGCLEIGNCYRTKQKALDFIRHAKIRVKLQKIADDAWGDVAIDWSDEDQGKWSLAYNHSCNKVTADNSCNWQAADTIYFPELEDTQIELAEIPEEDLKFYLGVK